MNDPDEMIPIFRNPLALGLGLKSANSIYRRAKRDRDFPPIIFHKGKNYLRRGDIDAYRAKLAQREHSKEKTG